MLTARHLVWPQWTSTCHGVLRYRWGDHGFTFAAGSPDASSDGRGAVCTWVGCGFPDRGDGCGWGPPENAGLVWGPFDVHQDCLTSGASPRVLDGMRGFQYRMTSYDEENGGPDFSTAYGIQLHDPWLLEYNGCAGVGSTTQL